VGDRPVQDCTLILTEGDSAKSLAVAGLSILGRDHYGVYPLKGKLLNVRDATHRQLLENKEVIAHARAGDVVTCDRLTLRGCVRACADQRDNNNSRS
jgi:DNA gyrase/topoisomerase IV subunit B